MSEKKTFIEYIAKKIWDAHHTDLEDIIIIFPNNRAAYYLRKAISRLGDKPMFSPQIYNYNQFVVDTSPFPLADTLIQVDLLYQCYRYFVEEPETFEQFFFWGQIVLNDFSFVNEYLLDSRQVFALIKDLKEIDDWSDYYEPEQIKVIKRYWNVFLAMPDDKKSKYVATWQYLHALYDSYFDKLEKEKLITLDIQKNNLANIFLSNDEEKIKSVLPKNCKKIYFCGFNQLSKSDEIIIQNYMSRIDSEMLWDYSPWMIEEKYPHEAGFYIRKYKKHKFFGDYFKKNSKDKYYINNQPTKIDAIACDSQYSQVCVLGNILNQLLTIEKKDPEETLIILPDALLLFSCLRMIPKEVKKVNVSIGFPLQNSPIFSLIRQIITLHDRVQTNKNSGIKYYHHEALIKIIEHPLLKKNFGNSTIYKFKYDIINKKRVYIKEEDILNCDNKLLGLILKPVNKFTHFCQYLKDIFNHLCISVRDDLSLQMILYVIEHLNYLEFIFSKWKEQDIDLKQFSKIFLYLIQSKHVPFTGYPLTGLQVMGIKETRNLNYKHIIILNLNENTWPATTSQKSLIPYTLKKGFEIPTYEEIDAQSSYVFFRLIERCETATLIYHTSVGAFSKGESSRFIKQIEIENKYQNYSHKNISQSYNLIPVQPIEIQIGAEKQQWLLDKPFSASMLNTYFMCPLRFYFQYVEKLSEEEQIEEEYDPRHVGNIFHQVMADLYKPYLGQILTPDMYQTIEGKMEETVDKFFHAVFNTKDVDHAGGNILTKENILNQVINMVNHDKNTYNLKILELEKKYEEKISINDKGEHKITLKAYIDRIDSVNGVTRILDYKTGKDENRFKNIEELFNTNQDKTKAIFQLFFYGILYRKDSTYDGSPFSLGIISTKDIHNPNYKPQLLQEKEVLSKVTHDMLEEYEQRLVSFIGEIGDSKFSQTEDITKCSHCGFKSVCRR